MYLVHVLVTLQLRLLVLLRAKIFYARAGVHCGDILVGGARTRKSALHPTNLISTIRIRIIM